MKQNANIFKLTATSYNPTPVIKKNKREITGVRNFQRKKIKNKINQI